MRPDQLGDYRVPSDPRIHPDGVEAVFVVSQMDLEEDRYNRRIWLWDGATARPLTSGPGDSSPRWSPDGSRLAFLRKGTGDDDTPQVAVLRLDGGEAEVVTAFDLGVTELEWSPDGSTIAVVAHEWTDDWKDVDPDDRARKTRRILRLPFRFDNRGWLDDRRSHVWLVDPDAEWKPTRLTDGDFFDRNIAWHPDGTELVFLSARHDERGRDPGVQVWSVPAGGGDVVEESPVGEWSVPHYAPDGILHAIGSDDRWAHPTVSPLRRSVDGVWQQVTKIDRDLVSFLPPLLPAGPQWLDDGSALCLLLDSGAVGVVRIEGDGAVEAVLGGDRAIAGISPAADGTGAVFVATTPADPGEVYWWDGVEEIRLTSLNDEFRQATALVEPERFTIDHDGVSIEGWVYLPPGDETVPLLVNIHGGPAAQYGYAFLDEFQVYAGAGYGVVATNPRGSRGYGTDHLRAIVGRWQDDDPPDLVDELAIPDTAAAQFPRLDIERLGVMGGSYGGFATIRVLAEDQRYRSAIAERGLYSFLSFAGTSDIGPVFDGFYLGHGRADRMEVLWAASPLRHAGRITTPTLVLHSEHDWRCPIEQGEQLFAVLWGNGVDTELVRFPPGEGHELSRSGKPRHRVERFEVVLDWHERHLM